MRKGIIYKITNKVNGKIYIGSTVKKNFSQRWAGHLFSARQTDGSIFQRALRKYGPDNFEKEVICTVLDENNLDDIEQYFIDFFKSLTPSGYNAVGVLKGTRKLVKDSMIKEWANPDTRANRIEKMREGSKKCPIVSVHIHSAKITFYESVHAAMDAGFAQSAIYFCLNGKDKTGQKHCWFRNEGQSADYFYEKALELLGNFKWDFTFEIEATNIETNVSQIFKDVYECSKFLNIPVKKIRRHIKGDKGYANYVQGYRFKYLELKD